MSRFTEKLLALLLLGVLPHGAVAAPFEPDDEFKAVQPYGEWEVTVAGKTAEIRDVLSKHDVQEFRRLGAPPPPIPVFPADQAVFHGSDLVFNWRDGVGEPRADHFRLCLANQGTYCGSAEAVQLPLAGAATEVGTRLSISQADLPLQWQGQNLTWKVGACAYRKDAYILNGVGSAEICTYAPPRQLLWEAPVVALLAPEMDNEDDPSSVTFRWHASGNSIAYFKFCYHASYDSCGPNRVDSGSDMREIHDPNIREFVFTSLSTFEGYPVQWQVAACNAADVCFWSQPRAFRFPALLGSYEQMRPVFRHEKCMNCHGFANQNAAWQRHIQQGRLQPADSLHDSAVCANCHNNGNFAPGWHAPNRHADFSIRSCGEITHQLLNDSRDFMRHHLTTDPLIDWAVARIPGLTQSRWAQLIDNWYDTNMRCARANTSNPFANGF